MTRLQYFLDWPHRRRLAFWCRECRLAIARWEVWAMPESIAAQPSLVGLHRFRCTARLRARLVRRYVAIPREGR